MPKNRRKALEFVCLTIVWGILGDRSLAAPLVNDTCEVIYESFTDVFPPSQVEPFHPLNIWFDGEHTGTIEIIPARNFKLCEIQFTAGHEGGENDYRLVLYPDQNGLPGEPWLGAWEVVLPPAKGTVGVTTVDVSAAGLELKRGQPYWVGLRSWNYGVGNIHLSTIPGLTAERAEILTSMGGWVRVNALGWDPNPGAWRLLGENLGGVDCTGRERIAPLRCRDQGSTRILTVKLKEGAPGDSFEVRLSSGPFKNGFLNQKGNGKAKFKNLPAGSGQATATWGCGASATESYNCP